MKRIILTAAALLLAAGAHAADRQYRLRVDGLACAYCAYGIEKAFMNTDGVEHVDIDFENGIVIVDAGSKVKFSEPELRKITNDAGFTLRGVEVQDAQQP